MLKTKRERNPYRSLGILVLFFVGLSCYMSARWNRNDGQGISNSARGPLNLDREQSASQGYHLAKAQIQIVREGLVLRWERGSEFASTGTIWILPQILDSIAVPLDKQANILPVPSGVQGSNGRHIMRECSPTESYADFINMGGRSVISSNCEVGHSIVFDWMALRALHISFLENGVKAIELRDEFLSQFSGDAYDSIHQGSIATKIPNDSRNRVGSAYLHKFLTVEHNEFENHSPVVGQSNAILNYKGLLHLRSRRLTWNQLLRTLIRIHRVCADDYTVYGNDGNDRGRAALRGQEDAEPCYSVHYSGTQPMFVWPPSDVRTANDNHP